ncbi:transcriptional regulator [Rhodothalassium salexigens]|uniref:helix-turn-helix domain-containing protein n=1 Tax=Rhodothalassium salexigens TaxID=1086 RepID=UPI0019137D0D|nr:helix-turn-helix transcriptional regulator [Rhodothalassium salexigens]MBK5912346.1 transcriptional regulator [Rhodothalassium salexigens]
MPNPDTDTEPKKPNPIDVHVGSRVRLRRTLMGMSQEKLGEALGLTFQQIQKYERGANRIGSSRLYKISQILEVPVQFFFDDMPDDALEGAELTGGGDDDVGPDAMSRRETLELMRAYYKINDKKVRKGIFELVKSVANATVPAEHEVTSA